MKKTFTFLLVLLLLTGCVANQEEVPTMAQMNELKRMTLELQTANEDLESRVNTLNAELAARDKSISELKTELEDIRRIAESNTDSIYSNDYLDYLNAYSYDAISLLDEYSKTNGRIYAINDDGSLVLDTIEFVAYYDEKRIEELKIDKDSPVIAASYIYNYHDNKTYRVSENFKIFVYDYERDMELKEISAASYAKKYMDGDVIFKVEMINGEVFRMTEWFLD